MDIDIDNKDDIEVTFMGHQACWHKTCQLKVNLSKKVVLEEDTLSIIQRGV